MIEAIRTQRVKDSAETVLRELVGFAMTDGRGIEFPRDEMSIRRLLERVLTPILDPVRDVRSDEWPGASQR